MSIAAAVRLLLGGDDLLNGLVAVPWRRLARRTTRGSMVMTRSTDRLWFHGDDSLDRSLGVLWQRLGQRITQGDGR